MHDHLLVYPHFGFLLLLWGGGCFCCIGVVAIQRFVVFCCLSFHFSFFFSFFLSFFPSFLSFSFPFFLFDTYYIIDLIWSNYIYVFPFLWLFSFSLFGFLLSPYFLLYLFSCLRFIIIIAMFLFFRFLAKCSGGFLPFLWYYFYFPSFLPLPCFGALCSWFLPFVVYFCCLSRLLFVFPWFVSCFVVCFAMTD